MDLLIVLTYAAICIVIFKLFKIPLNKWTVPTAVLGGILLVGTLIFVMNYNHPYSAISRQYFVTTPIVPVVKGIVTEVLVKQNTSLEKGDVLFRIDPTPYKNKLDSIKARLLGARTDFDRADKLYKQNAGSKYDLDQATSKFRDLQAQLKQAKYELDQTTVRAPDKGYVTQVTLRPGMMAVSLPLKPVMIFVSAESHYLIAWFRQNNLLRLEVGNEAEVVFDGIPGEIFSGKVQKISPAMAEGQVQPSGVLIKPQGTMRPGRIPVLIKITDPDFEPYVSRLPGGSFALTAVYSKHFSQVAVMRKVLMRSSMWMNYIFPIH